MATNLVWNVCVLWKITVCHRL